LGNNSIDYTRKRYIDDMPIFEDFDGDLKRCVHSSIQHLEDFYRALRPRGASSFQLVTFDQAIIRATGTLEHALRLARRGAVFETALVVRGLLEQIAWAWAASRVGVEAELFGISTTKAVTALKTLYPTVGYLYGVLSRYAHFDAELHHWFYAEQNGEIGTLFADTQTKIVASTWIFLLSDLLVAVLEDVYRKRRIKRLVLTRSGFRKRRLAMTCFDSYYAGIASVFVAEMRGLFPK
jgi:hypothetical protein